jgi:hypothetical protein
MQGINALPCSPNRSTNFYPNGPNLNGSFSITLNHALERWLVFLQLDLVTLNDSIRLYENLSGLSLSEHSITNLRRPPIVNIRHLLVELGTSLQISGRLEDVQFLQVGFHSFATCGQDLRAVERNSQVGKSLCVSVLEGAEFGASFKEALKNRVASLRMCLLKFVLVWRLANVDTGNTYAPFFGFDIICL